MQECDDQDETIAFLFNSAAYGETGPVERIDTHAAIVFLAGDRAFKLKRSVHYPYLDFSTLEKRKTVCDAELLLNRRTAPDMYLGVEFVGRQVDGTLALNAGVVVDWLVVMRRFPATSLFSTMAGKGELSPGLVRDLADAIAGFHDAAEVALGPGQARVRAVIEGNRASMAGLSAGLLPAESADRLAEQSIDCLNHLGPLLDRRARSGRVRHCHGDLHLGNICLWHGKPTLFDCLEFDVELATTDLLYDLAFLLMDLWHGGHEAEASLLFNRYCDLRDEAEGLAALALFLSMRAAVRAHVSGAAAERQHDVARRDRAVEIARGYLASALTFLDTAQPRLIAIGGLSGSGKSTLAGRLAPVIGSAPGARWLRSDVLRKRLAGVAPEQRLPETAYTKEHGRRVYDRLVQEAGLVLAAGTSVIVDAVFADPAERAAMSRVAAGYGVPFAGLWLDAPVEAMRQRVTNRTNDASDADTAVVDAQQDYVLGDIADWHRIDAAGSPDEVLAQAIAELERNVR